MKILAIIGVRFNNNYSNVNFEGKKDKKSNASAPISSTLKAVPVALMLAMSPMTTTNATEKVNQVEVAQVQDESNELYSNAVNYLLEKKPKEIPDKYKNDFNNIHKTARIGKYLPEVFEFGESLAYPSRAFVHLTNDEKLLVTCNEMNSNSIEGFTTYNFIPTKTIAEMHKFQLNDGTNHIRFEYYIVGEGWEQEMDEGLNKDLNGIENKGNKPCIENNQIKLKITEKAFNNFRKIFDYFNIPRDFEVAN